MRANMRSTLAVPMLIVGVLTFSPQDASAGCQDSSTSGIDWRNCDKKLLMLEGSNLKEAKLGGTDFTTTDLRNADLTGADLEKAKLVRASLAGSAAKGTRFARVEAYRTDFSGLEAEKATFESAELQRSNFKDAKLANANFTKAELGRSQFDGADVGGARFALANLARADFRGASFSAPVDFDRAFLFVTRIEGVDLSAATGLAQSQLDVACGSDETVLPAGLTKPASWPCKFEQD